MIDATKPARPRAELESCPYRLLRSAALYRRASSRVSVNRCEKRAPFQLLDALPAWFPEAA